MFRTPQWLFLVLSVAVMLCLAILTPVAAGPDEPTHLYRMQQISDGQLLSETVTESWDLLDRTIGHAYTEDASEKTLTDQGGYIDSGFKQYVSTNYWRLRVQGDKHFAFPFWVDEQRPEDTVSGQKQAAVFSNTVTNSPFLYVSQIIGYKIASVATRSVQWRVVAARIGGVLLYCLAWSAAIAMTPVGKWLFAAVGLLPSILVVNSCVTADTMTIAVCVLFVAAVLRLSLCDEPATWRELIFTGVLGVLLGFVKMTYFPLIVLLLLVPLLNRNMRTRRVAAVWGVSMAVGAACFLLWYAAVDSVNSGLMFARATDPDAQKAFVLSHPWRYCKMLLTLAAGMDVLNVNSYNAVMDQSVRWRASWLAVLLLLIAGCVAARDFARYSRRKRLCLCGACIGLFVICSVLVATALYMYWDVPGNVLISGVQARYFLPILVPLLLAIVALVPQPQQPEVDERYESSALAESGVPVFTVALIIWLVLMMVMFSNLMHFYYGLSLFMVF